MKTAPPAPSSSGPACKPRSTSRAKAGSTSSSSTASTVSAARCVSSRGIAEELDTLNVVLRSATEPFDTGSAAGRMMLQMLGVCRVRARHDRRPRHGRIPFGYARNENKELIPDERTAPVVRRVFTWYAAGRMGAAAIARRLDAEHAPAPPRGWQPAVVLWILANEAYVGRVHWRDQTFPGLHEPLIDQDTFDRAQALLKERGGD
jgi:site-specific DNA recombinase